MHNTKLLCVQQVPGPEPGSLRYVHLGDLCCGLGLPPEAGLPQLLELAL